MMPYLLFLALGLASLLQIALFPALRIGGVYPNLVLVMVVAWALLRGVRSALIWAVIAGAWLDLLSGGWFGVYTLGLMAVAALAGLGRRTVYRPTLLLAWAMLAIATTLQNGIQVALLWLNGASPLLNQAFLRLTPREILYNGLVMLLAYPVLTWIERKTGHERLPLE
ncbi:MAG: rod shape-determining protein MreD [Caldilineales bacterium]